MSAKTQTFQSAGSNLRDTVNQTMNMIRGKDVAGYTLYFIDGTSKQPAGSSDNIFMPHVTIGRGPKCHIKFGESYKTVSREHASISAEGSTHVLNHNPNATNPTLVNNQPISGPYYLKNGDEIQFSMQGPRIRYNIQSTPKASSMGLTSRIGSAVGQAVKPYKRGLSILGVLLLGSMAFGGYTFIEGQETKEELVETNEELGKTKIELTETKQKQKENETQLRENQNKLTNSEEELQALQDKYEKESEENVKARKELERKIINERNRQKELERRLKENEKLSEEYRVKVDKLKYGDSKTTQSVTSNENKNETITKDKPSEGSKPIIKKNNDVYPLREFDNDIYFIKVKNIKVNIPGFQIVDAVKQFNLSWSGTGFLTQDGKFITARHVLEGWKWFNAKEDEQGNCVEIGGLNPLFQQLNEMDAAGNVTVVYQAESPRGDELTFTNKMVLTDGSEDVIACNRFNRVPWEAVYTDWAAIDFPSRKGISKITLNRNFSTELKKGLEISISGYARGVGLQGKNLDPLYSKAIVAQDDLVDEVINFTGMTIDEGQSGGPCFVKNSSTGQYEAIGIVHGRYGNIGRIVPIWYTR